MDKARDMLAGWLLEADTEDDITNDRAAVTDGDETAMINRWAEKMSTYDFPGIDRFDYIDYAAFGKFREISENRKAQYNAYDEMTRDVIIATAVSMYAEDATQYDTSGRIIWVDAEDAELAVYLNDLLELLNIPKMLYSIAYSLVEYGDVYLRLYKKPKENALEGKEDLHDSLGKISDAQSEREMKSLLEAMIDKDVDYEDYVEIVDSPEDHFDLVQKGKTCQFAVVNQAKGSKSEQVELFPPDQFIHIYIENTHIRDKEHFEFTTYDQETQTKRTHQYKVRRGKSMLYDIYAVQKEIQLLESSMLLGRISKTAMTRSISVEVGDMSKADVRKLTRRIKSAMESKLSIRKFTEGNGGQMRSYSAPGGFDNIVVNPTRNGKGALSMQTFGGDFDPKSLIDMEYFNNKRCGGLRIPKAFIGFDEAMGSNAGGSLTKLDSRYGRTVKMVQSCIIAGITDMLNLFLLHRGMEDKLNEFRVHMVSPTTVDDIDRDDLLMNRLNLISTFSQAIPEEATYRNKLISYMLTKYSGDPEINRIILDEADNPPPDEGADEDEGEEDEEDWG